MLGSTFEVKWISAFVFAASYAIKKFILKLMSIDFEYIFVMLNLLQCYAS